MIQGTRPISLVVITLDGARHLRSVLESASFCDDRLVVDSGSTDDTVAIARAAGARVEFQPFLGYGRQKQRAVDLAAHDWILSLDDDEPLDDEAARAIAAIDLSDPSACWEIRRRTFVGTTEVRHGVWGREYVLRLFNRRTAGFSLLAVHEQVGSERPPRRLPGSIRHFSFENSSEILARSIRYARPKARIMAEKGQRTGIVEIVGRGLGGFLKSYLLKRGFLDGALGFVVAVSRVIDASLPRVMLLTGEVRSEGGDGDPPAPPPAVTPSRGAP